MGRLIESLAMDSRPSHLNSLPVPLGPHNQCNGLLHAMRLWLKNFRCPYSEVFTRIRRSWEMQSYDLTLSD